MGKSPLENAEVLVVDDELLLRKRLHGYLERLGASVTAVGTVSEARIAVAAIPFDFALVDIHLPDGQGLDLLRDRCFPQTTIVVIMTGEGGVEMAVEAMRLGAADYMAKPFDSGELPLVFRRALNARQSERLSEFRAVSSDARDNVFIGSADNGLRETLQRIIAADQRLRDNLPPVLIEGETGTGKTTFARWLHKNGPRAAKALVEVNCSALPESLVESELFGHERGAFTDAKGARIGLFEAADGGTLFLDELPSLSLAVQAKVLKVVEDGIVRRVGGNREQRVDVRLIAATNQDLQKLVRDGLFREDLYHRLDLLRLPIPPLRERQQDIPALAKHILAGLARKYRQPALRISAAGEARLLAYPWPGNVRELAHEIERCIVFSGGSETLDFGHLQGTGSPDAPKTSAQGAGAKCQLAANVWFNEGFVFPEGGFELEAAISTLIDHALKQSCGNVSGAARLLGVSRDYIRYRQKKD